MQHLLVIDDNPLILRLCQMVLAKAGFRLILAENAIHALQALEENTAIAAILLDSGLVSPSASEILQALEKRANLRNLPIILLVPKGGKVNHACMQFPNVCKVLEKPFSPSLLLQVTASLFRPETVVAIEARRNSLKASPPIPKSEPRVETPAPTRPETPSVCALMGQIQVMPLAEILQLLHFQSQTGIFRVHCEGKEVLVYFEKGLIQLATSRNLQKEFRLGDVLLQTRAVEPQTLEKLISRKLNQSVPLGEYLVSQNCLKTHLLQCALQSQTCALIYELLRWETGAFTFEALKALPSPAKQAQLNLRVEALLLEGYRRVDEWKILEREVGSLQTVMERTAQSRAVLDQLSQPEKNILANVDGTTTIEEILQRVYLPSFELYQVCRELVARKIIHQRSAQGAERHFDA